MKNHKERNITWNQVAKLIGKAWGDASSVSHGSLGFKVTDIFHFSAGVILDHLSIANSSITPCIETEPQLSTST
jgi:hypothetical protein